MPHTVTPLAAEGDLTEAVGAISASGIALILVITLIYGVIGKGRRRLASGPAQAIGIFAELAFLRANSFWRDIGEAIQSIPTGISTNAELGNPGMATVCAVLIVLSLFARLVPASGALIGLLMGAAFEASDGSIWQAIVSIFSVPFGLLGA
ncbi:hypothetical protein [Streptomyces sp. MP131-18]|uniref:hypothetical protein n=1 Tax=Streptomyces sp. MP131-18 TaxID=1857892 RepID=UPI00097C7743|nr:hypothetical protein [Streptomyces sp. MP131-18]ONK13290.1 hypothetical protein STBA_40530 [Streptomyces sp. MP131-18]